MNQDVTNDKDIVPESTVSVQYYILANLGFKERTHDRSILWDLSRDDLNFCRA